MKTKFYIFIFLFFIGFLPAFSQTQAEMNQTALNDYKVVDQKLNKIYQELIKNLPPKEKALLIKAQKNWIAFRDSDCEFAVSAYEGGSIQPLIKYTCLTEATQKRIEELENYLKEN